MEAALVAEAEEAFGGLLGSAGPDVILHGDLHHGNVLKAERAPWLVIDPKGVVGEREYEAGAFIRNPASLYSRPDGPGIVLRRVQQFAEELDADPQRIHGWAFAQAVLSAWWTYEDHGYAGQWALACAEWLRRH